MDNKNKKLNNNLFDIQILDNKLYETYRYAEDIEIKEDEKYIEISNMIKERNENDISIKLPPKYPIILLLNHFYFHCNCNDIIKYIMPLLYSDNIYSEYQNNYTWYIAINNNEIITRLYIRIYSSLKLNLFILECCYDDGDKIEYIDFYNYIYYKFNNLNILSDDKNNNIKINDNYSKSLFNLNDKIPELTPQIINNYITSLNSKYYDVIEYVLKTLIYFCKNDSNKILLCQYDILEKIKVFKSDKNLCKLIKLIQEMINSTCYDSILLYIIV